ncbi:MAG: BMC domain-containing protein [Elusimicrobia bacterium]|nr:BMC domain-containing protein [Elusimicrobiota bacterium]
MVESRSIAKGIEASDAMCKMAGVSLEYARPVSRGKYLVLVSGGLGEVQSSIRAGREVLGDMLEGTFVIPNAHPQVLEALLRKRAVAQLEAVGIVETQSVAAAVLAADAAVKASQVDLMEINQAQGIGGKAYFVLTSEVGAVRTAVSAACEAISALDGVLVSRVVIPQAHSALKKSLC